jgi:hypothetical protein
MAKCISGHSAYKSAMAMGHTRGAAPVMKRGRSSQPFCGLNCKATWSPPFLDCDTAFPFTLNELNIGYSAASKHRRPTPRDQTTANTTRKHVTIQVEEYEAVAIDNSTCMHPGTFGRRDVSETS